MLINIFNIDSMYLKKLSEFITCKSDYDINVLNEFENNIFSKFIAYMDNEKILGFIFFSDIYDRLDINYFFVDKDFRHHGIGQKLLDSAILYAKNKSYLNITLEVKVDNLAAINIYKKNGFNIKTIRKNYYIDTDGYLMEKELR